MDTECHIVHLRGYKGTHFSPGIRVQFEAPLYAVGGAVIARIAPLLGLEPRFELPPADKLILASAGGR